MTAVSPKVRQWIEEKRDPRSAHWQAGLEAVMELFLPVLEQGRVIPVRQMDEAEERLFTGVLTKVDLNPWIFAAFLPRSLADAIVPPESAEEVLRIEKGKPSCKLLLLRPGKEDRIICAEISEQAFKPGLDIFQSGALLGSYDYQNSQDCLDGLNKAVKAHAWKKDTWRTVDYHAYTLNWFDRVRFLGTGEISLDKNFSFFHSPTLIRADRVEALFLLIFLELAREYGAPDFLGEAPGLAEKIQAKDSDFCRTLARNHILDLLNLVKDLDLMDFSGFSDREHRDFQTEFTRTEERLRDRLIHLKPSQH